MVSLLAEVKIFRFWPKTMDYSPWFHFWESKSKVYQLKGNKKKNLMALVSVT